MNGRLPTWLWPDHGRPGLAEILLIFCLVGLLASAVFWLSRPAQLVWAAQDQQRRSDLSLIQKALQAYADDHDGQYPAVASGAGYYSCYGCGWQGAETEANSGQPYAKDTWIPALVEQGYISGLPTDPWQGSVPGCPVSGYIYLSGGIGYKLFDWCGPRTGLTSGATDQTYCSRPPYDGSQLNNQPAGAAPLGEMIDPARPQWGYAVYTYELACY